MGDVGHIGRCPFVAAILHALLCVPALRLDEGFTLDSSAPAARSISKAARGAPSDDCEEEAKQTRQLLSDLGFTGPFNRNHCDIPGITCDWHCRVEKLECLTCTGHLPEHIPLGHLQEVTLVSANLTGDIKAFQGMKMLTALNLQGTAISGDVRALEASTSLVKLALAGTNVVGDVKVFAELGLESLNLAYTNVAGNLTEFRSNLQELILRSTFVSGDLSVLAQLDLKLLDLSGTWVSGQLEDLISDGKPNLRQLKLTGTQLTGQLSALTMLNQLQEVDLAHTSITGQITNAWAGKLQDLTRLQLRQSLVQFVPDEEDFWSFVASHKTQSWESLLGSLQELDLTNCPVNSHIDRLLLPLAMSSLTSIKASGTGLSGSTPKLKEVNPIVNDEHVLDFTFPLAKSLVMLDVSRTHITKLRELPVQPNFGQVILMQMEKKLELAPSLLVEAQKQRITLDLTDTSLKNPIEATALVESGRLKTTDMYAYRDEKAGHACKDLQAGLLKVTPNKFLPEKLCACLPGWRGHGTSCQMCPPDKFSDDMGLDTCKSCPANSTAPEGSTKLAHCKCQFGDLHDGACSCDKHQTLRDGNCILCSKLHLQCNIPGISASSALPEAHYARLEPHAEEARRCLPPDVSQRCPGSQQCGLGYSGPLCTSCDDGFWPKGGRCKPCAKTHSAMWSRLLMGVAILLLAAYLAYRTAYDQQAPQQASVKNQLKRLIVLQAPGVLQMVQLWTVLSELQMVRVNASASRFPEIPYLESLQLTIDDLQNSLKLECILDAQTVRLFAAIGSPLAPLILFACTGALEFCRPGLGVNVTLKVLPFLFIGGASSTANLLSCQFKDGDGESLEDFAFRKALPQLRCYDRSGSGLWADAVGYGSALAYGVLIPLCLAGLMVRQYFALQHARLFSAHAEGEPGHITLRLEALQGHLPRDVLPKRLLAAVAAYMAVHCRGKRLIHLHDKSIITSAKEDMEEIQEVNMSIMKVVADAEASRNIDMLRTRRLTEMLTERIMLDETEDRLLIGSQSLLCKYALSQDVWSYVVMRLFAVALVCCVSMSDAWKWAVAFSLGMAVMMWVCEPYMWPQVSQLQSLSCVCLAAASVAFAYNSAWLARAALVAPLLLLLWQARCPDCTESLAERLYEELQSELPKLQRGEGHEVMVQHLRF